MSDAHWAALGAFLSGAASVITASLYVRAMRKRAEEECRKRFEALREGLRIGKGEE